MISKRLKAFFVALSVQLLIPSLILAAAIGQFTSVVGDVTQARMGAVIKPEVKSPIQMQDLIVTGDRSAASMLFDDESTIALAANSKFEVKEFLVRDNARKGILSLAIGKLTADVRKFIGGDSVFEVHSPTAVAGVRGTGFEFAVAMVGGQLTSTVNCTAGTLSVSALSATGAVVTTTTIVAGQTAVVSAGAIGVSATAAGAAGAGAATGAAGTTGAAAGTAAAAGITAGTITAGAAAAAAAVAAAVAASGSETTTTQHTTPAHH